MARTKRNTRLENRTARLKLDAGKRYWITVGEGLALGYRRTAKGYGTWEARLWKDGAYAFKTLGEADDFKDANGEDVLTYFQAANKARQFEQDAKHPFLAPVTVTEAAERYLAWYREHRKAYRDTACCVTAHILPKLGKRVIGDLTTREIKDWHARLAATPARKRTRLGETQAFRTKPLTADEKRARKATANRVLTVLKAILNKAFQDELVADDTPWRRVKPFGNVEEPIVRFLSESEASRLIHACPEDFRQLVKAALFTGARYSEIARLRAANVNLDTGHVFISAEAKSGRGRHVPLSAEGMSFFQEAMASKTGDSLVFTRADGKAWGRSHQSRPMKEACEAVHIRPAIGFHELRHTYASLLAQAGADLLTISKLLGHADTRITSRHYAHLCDKTLMNAVRTLLPDFGHLAGHVIPLERKRA